MSGFFTPGRILDLIILAIVIFAVIRYIRSGFIAGLLDLFGTVCSVIVAKICSNKFSPTLFEKLFKNNLIERTTNALNNSEGVITINELLNKISSFLPQNIIDIFWGENASLTFNLNTPDIAQRIVTEVVQPLVIPVITILVFYGVFVVCRILLQFVEAALRNINRLPKIGKYNTALGGVIGLAVGLVYAFLVVCAVWAMSVITGGEVAFFREANLQQSFFYTIMANFIPFV